MARAIMIMGTGSDVGKSLVTTGLCRAFTNRGMDVRPFKPQNMSNNAAVTVDGGEIGRAQALQARACKVQPVTAMNPVLLKPEQEAGAQIVLRGKRVARMRAREYFARRGDYLPHVVSAFGEMARAASLVFVEGAGSASEVNLRTADIANFGFARALDLPVILVGDIRRGGVIASIIGTFEVLQPADRALVVGTLINRFQGDPCLFEEGRRYIEARTGVPCWGPLPEFPSAALLPPEDILALDHQPRARVGGLKIVVPRLPRIANFDDLDPLRQEEQVTLVLVEAGSPLPMDADLVILPGSKSTISDFGYLCAQGWDIDIRALARQGARILGICGGYQMLGQEIADPAGIEGRAKTVDGLGLLSVKTTLGDQKQLRLECAVDTVSDTPLSGYHMHMGETVGEDCQRPFVRISGAAEGAVSKDGRIMGTYLHGLFASDPFRRMFLAKYGARPDPAFDYEWRLEQILDDFAAHLETHCDLDQIAAKMAATGD